MSDTAVKKCRCGLDLTGGLPNCTHCDTVCFKRSSCKQCKSLDNLELDVAFYGYM